MEISLGKRCKKQVVKMKMSINVAQIKVFMPFVQESDKINVKMTITNLLREG